MTGRVLLRKTFRDLRAGLGQTVALAVIVALGVASLIAMAGAYRDLGHSYRQTYDRLRLADASFILDSLPDSMLAAVAASPGVRAATGRLIVDAGLVLPPGPDRGEGEVIRSRLIGMPVGTRPEVNDLMVLRGRYLEPGDSMAALLESHFADIYHLGPGDSVTPLVNGRPVRLRVAGVVASPEYLIVSPGRDEVIPTARTFAVLFVDNDELARLTGQQGLVNDVGVLFAAGADPETTVARVDGLLSQWGDVRTTRQADQASVAALRLDLEGYRELAGLMPGLILLVAAFALYVMLGRLVRGQRPQVGLMKALGYPGRAVIGHYLMTALAIAVAGSLAGVAGGIPLGRLITSAYAGELGIPLVVTHLHLDLAAAGIVVSLLVAILAGLGPARASARLAPARAMEINPAEALARGRRSAFERLVPLPLWLRLPLRSAFRVRRRAVSTGLGIVLALVLVLVGWGMISAMDRMMTHNFDEVELWDVDASFAVPQSPAVLDSVRAWPGVRAATPLLRVPARLRLPGRDDKEIVLTALEPGQRLHALLSSSGRPVALERDRLVLTDGLASRLGLAAGDSVTVATPLGERRLVLGATVNELMAGTGYVTLEDARRWSGLPAVPFNGLYLAADSASAPTIKRRLYGLPGAAAVRLKARVRQDWQSLMGLLNVFMGVILAFALAMAFALLYNAMTVNVLERRRELATMRAIGTGRGRVALLILVENALLWLMALAPGLALGWWVARRMGGAFQSDLFSFSVSVRPLDMTVAALGILATMLLAALPAIRRVGRMSLAEEIKILT